MCRQISFLRPFCKHKLKEIKVIFGKKVYIDMSYSYPTTIYESIFAQIYVFPVEK